MASAREGSGCSRGSKYDVFLSFRGPDTRKGFVDCLYEDMMVAGIRVFIDNERLHVGEVIGEELIRAIDDSKIFMPVFSRGYASSKWCLFELKHIMMGRIGHEIWPIFYDVTPDDVKLKTRLYSDDLEVLEKDHGTDVVNRWRECLKEVCKIKGWNSKESQGEGKMIQRIVKEVLYKTKKRYMNVTDHLVGMDGQIEKMMKILDDQIDHVRIVIIHGMGGIGKTTLARVIFNDVSSKFEGCSFLSNVRASSQGNGIVKLQQQILKDVFGTSFSIFNEHEGVNEITNRCSNKRVLLVLDDVDDKDQIQKLAGMFDWFGRGSRIIITTRDSKVIPNGLLSFDAQRKNKKQKIEGEDYHGDICYYEIQEMDHQQATTLFKRHAFNVDENSFDNEDLLQEIVASTGGLPLALEVVGSHLFGETEAVWRETLRKLKRAPHKKVQNALMISYEALEDSEKHIFLDIACFFRGTERRILMYVWDDLYPKSGVKALLHKSLIKIDDGDRIWMHDQLRDLGREINRRDGKSCRIWIHEEAFRMISTKKGTRDVISLDLGELSRSCKFENAAFQDLVNLRVLRLSGGNLEGDFSNCFPQLMWLEWRSFPSSFQAQNFSPLNLVVLRLEKADIDETDIDERWTGWKGLLGSKLKFLELSGCGGLTRTPDFSTCLGLEVLVLQHNKRLIEIDSSIGKLEQLLHLEIKDLPNLRGLPQSLALLKRMEKLIVTNVYEVGQVKFHLPIEFDNLKSLCHLAIEGVRLESLPKGIGQLKLLKYLSLARCRDLMSLPESVWELESLVELNLSNTGLMVLSGKVGSMKELKVLNLSSTNIWTLPEGIWGLVKLEELNLNYCSELEQIPSEIENLFSLRVLNLRGTGIVELPSSVIRLSCLQNLNMDFCSKLRKVEQLPTSLSHLYLPYFSGSKLQYLSFSGCRHLTSLPESVWEMESLVQLNLMNSGLEGLSGKIRSIKELKVLNLSSTNIRTMPEAIGGLVKLEELDLSYCSKLEHIPSEIGNLFSLRVLNLRATDIVELPSSVIRLSRLQHLYMDCCFELRKVEQLPTSLSHLSLAYFSLQVVPDLSNLVNIVQLALFSHGDSFNYHGPPITDDEEDRWTRFRSLNVAWIERLPKLKRLVIEVELGLSCSVSQFLSQLPHTLNELALKKFWATILDLSLFPNLSELDIFGLLSDEIELRGLELLGNLRKIVLRNCQSLVRLSISSCPKELNSLRIIDCPKLVEVEGVSRLESLQTLSLCWCPSLPRLSDLSNLVKMKELWMHDCDSIERMPALPRMEIPFNLDVKNCGKLRDFDGPHDLYVDIIEGPDRCLILRRRIKCISDLFLFCFCFPQK